MKSKPTLYIVMKYNDNGYEVGREVFHIYETNLEELKNKFSGNEYDIFLGRHNKHGQPIITEIVVSR